MEFKVFQKEIELQSKGWRPTFHDVSKEIMEIVKASGIKNGTVAIASHHTTCSVMVQECSHDIDLYDLEYLQHDLLKIMQKIVPDYSENTDRDTILEAIGLPVVPNIDYEPPVIPDLFRFCNVYEAWYRVRCECRPGGQIFKFRHALAP